MQLQVLCNIFIFVLHTHWKSSRLASKINVINEIDVVQKIDQTKKKKQKKRKKWRIMNNPIANGVWMNKFGIESTDDRQTEEKSRSAIKHNQHSKLNDSNARTDRRSACSGHQAQVGKSNWVRAFENQTKPKRKTQNHIRAFWGLVFSWCAGDKANCVVVVIIDCNLPKLTKEKNTFKLSLELKLKWKWKLKMMQSEMEESETITNTV